MAAASSREELDQRWREHPNRTFESGILYLNKAYALRQNYLFIASDVSRYQHFVEQGIHPSWLKIPFVKDTLTNAQNNCSWVLLMDSDAYIWMDAHELSLEDWAAVSSLHELCRSFHTHAAAQLRMRGYYPLSQQPAHFMIGLNGISGAKGMTTIHTGTTDGLLNMSGHYVNAGNWAVRNSRAGLEFLDEWWQGTEADGGRHKAVHPWEQSYMARVMYPKHQYSISLYGYSQFHSPGGNGLRHLWKGLGGRQDILIYGLEQIMKDKVCYHAPFPDHIHVQFKNC